MTPKARIRKLETKRKQDGPNVILIDWDDTIEPKPGETVITWEPDGEITAHKAGPVRLVWTPHKPKPEEPGS